MRISDLSSDECSSDLQAHYRENVAGNAVHDFLGCGVIGPISRTGGREHPEAAFRAVLERVFVGKLRVEIGFGGLVAAHRRKGHEEPSHDESFLEEGNRPLAVSGLRIVGPRALVRRRMPAYQSRSIFMSCGCDLPHTSLSEKSCSPRRTLGYSA